MSTESKTDFLKKFGENLRKIRTEKGISQKSLVEALHTSQSYLAKIELGQVSPSILKAAAIAHALEIEINELFDFKIETKPAASKKLYPAHNNAHSPIQKRSVRSNNPVILTKRSYNTTVS